MSINMYAHQVSTFLLLTFLCSFVCAILYVCLDFSLIFVCHEGSKSLLKFDFVYRAKYVIIVYDFRLLARSVCVAFHIQFSHNAINLRRSTKRESTNIYTYAFHVD